MSSDYVNDCDYIPIFDRFFKYFSKVFCKGSWSAYNNIAYTKICQRLF